MKHALKIIIVHAVFFLAGNALFAMPESTKPIDTVYVPYFELVGLTAHLNDSGRTVSYIAHYNYTNIDSAGTTTDSLSESVLQFNGGYIATQDSSIIVQDQLYSLAIKTRDSSILVSRPQSVSPFMLQADLFDNALQSVYLDSMAVSDSSNTRKLRCYFNGSSPYKSYQAVYDTSSFRLTYVLVELRHGIPIPDPTTGYAADTYFTRLKVTFTNYSDLHDVRVIPISTADYIQAVPGGFKGVNGYAAYTSINQTNY